MSKEEAAEPTLLVVPDRIERTGPQTDLLVLGADPPPLGRLLTESKVVEELGRIFDRPLKLRLVPDEAHAPIFGPGPIAAVLLSST